MTRLRPTPEQERWIAAAVRLGVDRDRPWIAERIGGWKAVGMFTRGALFALGAVAAVLTVAITSFLHVPGPLVIAGILLVVVAEWLVARGRFFGAGIEEALELSGLLLIVVDLADVVGGANSIRAAVLIGLALAVAGWRFLNPLFVTLAALAFTAAVDLAASAAGRGAMPSAIIAGLCAFATGAFAMTFGAVRFRRPSHDQMLDWLVVVMPLAGYLWLAGRNPSGMSREFLRHASVVGLLPLVMPVLIGAAGLTAGIRRRSHAPILAFMVCVGCIAYELRNLTGLALEVRLIVWGSVALVVALALDRYLRTPRRGITTRRSPLAGGAGATSDSTSRARTRVSAGASGRSRSTKWWKCAVSDSTRGSIERRAASSLSRRKRERAGAPGSKSIRDLDLAAWATGVRLA